MEGNDYNMAREEANSGSNERQPNLPEDAEHALRGGVDVERSAADLSRPSDGHGIQQNHAQQDAPSNRETSRAAFEGRAKDSQPGLKDPGIGAVVASVYTSGPVPRAEEFYLYTGADRERILRIAESFSTDESERLDRVVRAQVKLAQRAQWLQALVTGVCLAAAFATMVWAHSPWGAFFLAAPIIQAIGVPIQGVASKKRKDENEQ